MEKKTMYRRDIFVILVLAFPILSNGRGPQKRLIVLQGFSGCPDSKKNPAHFTGSFKSLGMNKYDMNGEIKIDEFLTGPMELQATTKRCSMDRSQCEHFNTFVLPDVCKVLHQKNQFWTDFMDRTEPRISCPLKPSTIKIANATIDYSLFAHLPIDGYTWVLYAKILKPIANVRHRKRMILCMIVEVAVNTVRAGKNIRKDNTTQQPIVYYETV